jgi:hypothetical protein
MRILNILRRRICIPASAVQPATPEGQEHSTAGALDVDLLKQMVRDLAITRAEEIGCDTCFGQIDLYVELVLAGRSPAEAMPLVEHHLTVCKDCRDEFEALLMAVREMGWPRTSLSGSESSARPSRV